MHTLPDAEPYAAVWRADPESALNAPEVGLALGAIHVESMSLLQPVHGLLALSATLLPRNHEVSLSNASCTGGRHFCWASWPVSTCRLGAR